MDGLNNFNCNKLTYQTKAIIADGIVRLSNTETLKLLIILQDILALHCLLDDLILCNDLYKALKLVTKYAHHCFLFWQSNYGL